jgi:hypothetical protein
MQKCCPTSGPIYVIDGWFSDTHTSLTNANLGHVLPVAEKTYRRLLMLMNVMTTNLPHAAGLNPKGTSIGGHR